MSTKADVYHGDRSDFRCYEETSQQRCNFGETFCDLVVIIESRAIQKFFVKGSVCTFQIRGYQEFSFLIGDMTELEVDSEGVNFEMKGGGFHTKKVGNYFKYIDDDVVILKP